MAGHLDRRVDPQHPVVVDVGPSQRDQLRTGAPVIAASRSANAATGSNSPAAAIAARTSSSDITPLGGFLVVLCCESDARFWFAHPNEPPG
jgi:hypothetical protein